MLISVIVPTCNRIELLARCLACLAPGSQSLSPKAYEVIVTDDGAAMTAAQLVREKFAWARWTEGPRRGPAANRNHGAQVAVGEWLAFTDDDCLPDRAWLETIARAAESGRMDVVEGKTIIPDNADNPFRMGVENLTGGCYWTCNLAVRLADFRDLGGFDEDFLEAGGEDMLFAYHLKRRNLRTLFAPEALVLHPTRAIGISGVIYRTRLQRWMLLYELKTDGAALLTGSVFAALCHVAWSETMRLLRTTSHLLTRPQPGRWRTRLFWQAWNWLAFPIVLPYMLVWELRFRTRLRSVGREQPCPISASVLP